MARLVAASHLGEHHSSTMCRSLIHSPPNSVLLVLSWRVRFCSLFIATILCFYFIPHVTLSSPLLCRVVTARVPQMLLEQGESEGKPTMIMVSQPRRIAVTALKRRLQEALGAKVGLRMGDGVSGTITYSFLYPYYFYLYSSSLVSFYSSFSSNFIFSLSSQQPRWEYGGKY